MPGLTVAQLSTILVFLQAGRRRGRHAPSATPGAVQPGPKTRAAKALPPFSNETCEQKKSAMIISSSRCGTEEATFDDVAIYFSSEEWNQLDEDQKTIYKDVMTDNYEIMVSLGYDIPKPEVLVLMEQGRDPCIGDSAGESIDIVLIDEDDGKDPTEANLFEVSDCPKESNQVEFENTHPEVQNFKTKESLLTLKRKENALQQSTGRKQWNDDGRDLSQREVVDGHNENFNQPSNSAEHLLIHQEKRKKEVIECEKKVDDQTKLALGQRDHKGETINQFHIDGKTFIVRSILAEKQRSEDHYKCQKCERSFSKELHLTAHERTHRKEKIYQCTDCEKSFHHKSGILAHQRIHSGATPHQCAECQQSFSYKSALIVHRKIHSKKPVQTPQLIQKLQLVQMLQPLDKTNPQPVIQIGDKPHKCSSCEKRFNDPALLVAHQKVHAEDMPHRCSQCPKEFENAALLVVHLRTHMPDKPHKCDQCDKSFNNPLLLVNHKRTHTDESQHPCNQCTKTFNDQALLLAHKKIHIEKKPQCGQGKESGGTPIQEKPTTVKLPYKCNQCDKSFSYQTMLNEHLKVHVGDKPHKCDKCEKSFNDPALLVAHRKTHTDLKYLNAKPVQTPPQGSQPSITSQKT
ncbi:zinc finger protein 182-like [Rhinatrema bivittatum]|uniref:zinc finger protein 182-like n=1 Tax=Rhinatrema bivittatum TaxID=194408 RepID=UPI0011276E86|nr:zinc finger protein 182-like [Rhinatrema bivittatum]